MTTKYAQSKIYKITGGGMTYFGSTTKKYLSQRMGGHREDKKRFDAGKSNNCLSSFQILDTPDYQITLIESFPCQSRDELRARERYYIENNDCVNKNIPGRTLQEWHTAHPDYQKNLYIANRVERLKYQNDYNQRKKAEKQPVADAPDTI
jgi:hypothetical protein